MGPIPSQLQRYGVFFGYLFLNYFLSLIGPWGPFASLMSQFAKATADNELRYRGIVTIATKHLPLEFPENTIMPSYKWFLLSSRRWFCRNYGKDVRIV